MFDDSKRLKSVGVSVLGSTEQVLFDSGVVQNVMAASQYSQLYVQPQSTNRRITTGDGSKGTVLGEKDKVPITLGGLTYVLTFFVVSDVPFGRIIRRPSMTTM